MTLIRPLWLPALAMATSALATHLYLENNAPMMIDNDLERVWDTLFAPVPQQPEYLPAEPVRANRSTATTLPARQIPDSKAEVLDIWERLRAGFKLPQQAEPSVQAHIQNCRNHPHHSEGIAQYRMRANKKRDLTHRTSEERRDRRGFYRYENL